MSEKKRFSIEASTVTEPGKPQLIRFQYTNLNSGDSPRFLNLDARLVKLGLIGIFIGVPATCYLIGVLSAK